MSLSGHWNCSNLKRDQLLGQRNPMGYVRPSLIHLEPSSCPPDLLHLTKGVILKQFNQVILILLLINARLQKPMKFIFSQACVTSTGGGGVAGFSSHPLPLDYAQMVVTHHTEIHHCL